MNSIFFNKHDEHKYDPIMKYIIDPTVAEAFAAWKAVVFGKDLGLYNYVILDGNALEIVHTPRREDQTWAKYREI